MATVVEFKEFEVTPGAIAESLRIVEKKSPHINPRAPNGDVRPPELIASNIFHGSIAQFAVEQVLKERHAKNIEIYDRIRTDDFRYSDEWDMRTIFGETTRFIEVRSSYATARCTRFTEREKRLACIRESYNLIAAYQTSFKPGEMRKNLFFQVYWQYDADEAMKTYELYLNGHSKETVTCFVVGFATRKLVERKAAEGNLQQRRAKFQLIPIREIYPCSKLAEIP